MASSSSSAAAHRRPKVAVIMGATGCGKSRLSIDLASHFPFEVINADKMQVYWGLDITTNKIPPAERHGVPHHLLSSFDPNDGEMTPSQFSFHGDAAISGVASRGKLPLLVGGSNSFIHALLADRFDPEAEASPELRYDCCILWVHVSPPVLKKGLPKRVNGMLRMGAFDELAGYYHLRQTDPGARAGLRKAIGVLEFDRYFEKYPPLRGDAWGQEDARERQNDPVREGAYQEALREIMKNADHLIKGQVEKIRQLSKSGWVLHRLDATQAVRLAMAPKEEGGGDDRSREVWEREVVGRSVEIVNQFLREN
ncbi:hypothetical protein EUGRSUZ_C02681 [Eucalyptus grandis]|uniref:Adenylate isopentenyltransferase n=2 Tax=Eucalyptus grandis TaxID=71139 RepID=A0A059CTP4_EUCGR|nr:hypothetical protein EUGRSUZ_C02681 [Eucalyptus grandis]